jgi:hypothetical protein
MNIIKMFLHPGPGPRASLLGASQDLKLKDNFGVALASYMPPQLSCETLVRDDYEKARALYSSTPQLPYIRLASKLKHAVTQEPQRITTTDGDDLKLTCKLVRPKLLFYTTQQEVKCLLLPSLSLSLSLSPQLTTE